MIEAYCTRRSYTAGDQIDVHVSTDADRFDVIVQRAGRLKMVAYAASGIAGADHGVPDDAVANGCGWPVSTSFAASTDWKSGFFKIRVTSVTGEIAETFFILRAAQPTSQILWVIETNTWNAYNMFGGASTYTADGDGYVGGTTHASFLRPLPNGTLTLPDNAQRLATVGTADTSIPYIAWAQENGLSMWTGAASWGHWPQRFLDWLESETIDVDYAANEDLEAEPRMLADYRLMLSVGHDEYWTWGMRDTVEGFIAKGGNVAFLSGNTAFWQVRLEQDKQQMIAYKANFRNDPVVGTDRERYNTGLWSNRLTGRPETEMTGLSFARGGYARVAGATPASAGGYTIYRHKHWALEGTGLSYGDQLGAASSLVGYECDGCDFQFRAGLPYPTGAGGTPLNFEIIGVAPVALWTREIGPPGLHPDGALTDLELVCDQLEGEVSDHGMALYAHGHAVMGCYTAPGGGTVFSGGTTDWAFALDDAQVSRITRNVIDRLSGTPLC